MQFTNFPSKTELRALGVMQQGDTPTDVLLNLQRARAAKLTVHEKYSTRWSKARRHTLCSHIIKSGKQIYE